MATLAELIAEHRAYVRASLARLGVPAPALDDAEQEVFVVLVRRIAEFDPRSSHRRWLFGISRRVAWAYRRRARRACEVHATTTEAWTRPPVEDRLDAHRVLNVLDTGQRNAWLAHVEGRTAAEIAASTEVPLTTIQWRLRTAARRVRDAIATAGRRCNAIVLAITRPVRGGATSLGMVSALFVAIPTAASPPAEVSTPPSAAEAPRAKTMPLRVHAIAHFRSHALADARPHVREGVPTLAPEARPPAPRPRAHHRPSRRVAAPEPPEGRVRLLPPRILRLPPGVAAGPVPRGFDGASSSTGGNSTRG